MMTTRNASSGRSGRLLLRLLWLYSSSTVLTFALAKAPAGNPNVGVNLADNTNASSVESVKVKKGDVIVIKNKDLNDGEEKEYEIVEKKKSNTGNTDGAQNSSQGQAMRDALRNRNAEFKKNQNASPSSVNVDLKSEIIVVNKSSSSENDGSVTANGNGNNGIAQQIGSGSLAKPMGAVEKPPTLVMTDKSGNKVPVSQDDLLVAKAINDNKAAANKSAAGDDTNSSLTGSVNTNNSLARGSNLENIKNGSAASAALNNRPTPTNADGSPGSPETSGFSPNMSASPSSVGKSKHHHNPVDHLLPHAKPVKTTKDLSAQPVDLQDVLDGKRQPNYNDPWGEFINFLKAVLPTLFGLGYATFWTIVNYPQIWLNYERKAVKGMSVGYILYNLIGFICYSLYVVIQRQIQHKYHMSEAVTVQDVIFAVHGLCCIGVILFQVLAYGKWSTIKKSIYTQDLLVIVVLILIVVVSFLMACMNHIPWHTVPDHLRKEVDENGVVKGFDGSGILGTLADNPADSTNTMLAKALGEDAGASNSLSNSARLGAAAAAVGMGSVAGAGNLQSGSLGNNADRNNADRNRHISVQELSPGRVNANSRRRLQDEVLGQEQSLGSEYTAIEADASKGQPAENNSSPAENTQENNNNGDSEHHGESFSWGQYIITHMNFITILGLIKVIITLIKYPSQILFNFQRGSTDGLSLWTYIFDSLGASCSLAQNFFLAWMLNDIQMLLGNLPKLFIGEICLAYDVIILLQFALLRNAEAPRPSGSSNAEDEKGNLVSKDSKVSGDSKQSSKDSKASTTKDAAQRVCVGLFNLSACGIRGILATVRWFLEKSGISSRETQQKQRGKYQTVATSPRTAGTGRGGNSELHNVAELPNNGLNLENEIELSEMEITVGSVSQRPTKASLDTESIATASPSKQERETLVGSPNDESRKGNSKESDSLYVKVGKVGNRGKAHHGKPLGEDSNGVISGSKDSNGRENPEVAGRDNSRDNTRAYAASRGQVIGKKQNGHHIPSASDDLPREFVSDLGAMSPSSHMTGMSGMPIVHDENYPGGSHGHGRIRGSYAEVPIQYGTADNRGGRLGSGGSSPPSAYTNGVPEGVPQERAPITPGESLE